jgi:hypothetical protein
MFLSLPLKSSLTSSTNLSPFLNLF